MTSRAIRWWGGGAVIAAGALAMTTARVAADTYPRQPGIRIANYTFDISVNDANNEFIVQETVDVRFVAASVDKGRSGPLQVQRGGAESAGRQPIGATRARSPPAAEVAPRRARTGGKGMTVTAVTADGRP